MDEQNKNVEKENVESKKDVKNQSPKVETPSAKTPSNVVKIKRRKPETAINTDSDEEFHCKPLPIPGKESDDFYDDLVKNVEVETMGKKGKELRIVFVCKMCATTCGRKTDVKRHWKQSCAGNPDKEIICRHCQIKNEKNSPRGESNLIVHLQQVHELKGDFICLKCQALFSNLTLRDKHTSGCKGLKK